VDYTLGVCRHVLNQQKADGLVLQIHHGSSGLVLAFRATLGRLEKYHLSGQPIPTKAPPRTRRRVAGGLGYRPDPDLLAHVGLVGSGGGRRTATIRPEGRGRPWQVVNEDKTPPI
jgi:hypothetical protein